jgi:pyrophosphate--fructose-6-phosphate 1-phosphotransferase
MGRSASHIALECALQTQPNICFISEEIQEKKTCLNQLVEVICDSVIKRAENKENFGIVLIPEGVVEFIPEMKKLIQELNNAIDPKAEKFLKYSSVEDKLDWLERKLSRESLNLFHSLPLAIAMELLADRDPHGNVQVSKIETERLLMIMVEKRLAKLKEDGDYKGKFSPVGHFFGYEGRSAIPSNFDTDYCYSLGYSAFVLIAEGLTGYIANIKNLVAPADEWIAGGVPLTMMMNMEQRHGAQKPVIKKAMVDLNGNAFKTYKAARDIWAIKTCFVYPGAIQYFGPPEICDQPTKTLKLEHKK